MQYVGKALLQERLFIGVLQKSNLSVYTVCTFTKTVSQTLAAGSWKRASRVREEAMASTAFDEPVSPKAMIRLLDYAFEHAPIAIAIVDSTGRILRANARLMMLFGLTAEALRSVSIRDMTHPDDLPRDLTLAAEIIDGKRDSYTVEKRYFRPDGSLILARTTVIAMNDPDRGSFRYVSQIEDISAEVRSEQELAERAAQLELAMEAVRGGFWHMDVAQKKFETSDRLAQFIGGSEAARLDLQRYVEKINSADGASADLTPLLDGEVDQSVAEYRLMTVNGERWMRCDRRLLRDEAGHPKRIVGVVIDFTDEKTRMEHFERSAETDALTGLLNRRGLAKGFDKLASSNGFALLIVDLDGFKQINDTHGHAAGDTVLIEIAERLRDAVRHDDLVSRTGGDEFVLFVATDREGTEAVARRIVKRIRDTIGSPSGTLVVSASVGAVWSASKETDLSEFLSQADRLLYRAKSLGKDGADVGTLSVVT